MNVNKETEEQAERVIQTLPQIPRCKSCQGKGTTRPMFHDLECEDCSATGIDISDPLAIILQQQKYLAKAKGIIVSQRRTIYGLTVSSDEQLGQAMDKFYSSIKRMD